jgi:transcriptional regulator with XRE-family HTH domain
MVDPDPIAEAQWDLGRQLAAYRQAAGLNQVQLARRTAYSRSTIANVETGRQSVPKAFWERCDAALATGRVLTAKYEEIEQLKAKRRQAVAEANEAQRQARLRQLQAQVAISPEEHDHQADPLLGSAWSTDLTQVRDHATDLWTADCEASGLSAEDSAATSSVALRWLVAPQEETTAREAGWRRIGQGDVDRVRGVRCQLKAIDQAYGGGTAFPMAVTYLRREVGPLLTGRYGDAVGRALCGAVAELSLDVGWMAYDAAGHRLAHRYMSQALRLSHAAGDRLFGGRVLAAMSHQALHLGYVVIAVDLAGAARTGTTGVAPPKAIAMLAAMEAMAQAAARDAGKCAKSLVIAEKALDRAQPGDDPAWLDFDEGGLWGHAARAYRYLHQGDESVRYAQDSMTHCLGGHGRTHAQRAAILAAAYLRLGHVDQAAAVGSSLVTEAWNLHSRHVYEEVAFLVRAIDGQHTQGADEFLDQAREYLVARSAL